MVGTAMREGGLTGKQMALTMEISPQQFSNQMAADGTEHLSLWRALLLPRDFWARMVPQLIAYHNLDVGESPVQRRRAEIGRLVEEVLQLAPR